ncbi:ferric transport system permease protein FbpB [Haemophilus influenzae]|uniref:Ferric transport system permease protein FbpB n=1 Tax=Haemophilus influenzae TaxID=727 RepID=A0A2X1PHW1_HAEIF|nr:ferric transport system permease protein FbpB [Haemophilus influenzae]
MVLMEFAIAQILAFAPISFMILDGALKSVHPSIEEASYTLRANRYSNVLSDYFFRYCVQH